MACTDKIRGLAYVQSVIQSQPLTSDFIAHKLLHLCKKYKLIAQQQQIQNDMGNNLIIFIFIFIFIFIYSKINTIINTIINK